MSLSQWLSNGWVKTHKTTPQEISNLFALVQRDIKDAISADISSDWRFGIAYNAALKLCTILLYASGYRATQGLAHYRTLHALPLVLGAGYAADAEYLDTCRVKRNTVEYDYVGGATKADAIELVGFVRDLQDKVVGWLKMKHPLLLPDDCRDRR